MSPTSPCALVIFGASGDLAQRKLLPAIYELARESLLPENFAMVGFARTSLSDEQFRLRCRGAVETHIRSNPIDPIVWRKLQSAIYYVPGDYAIDADYDRLGAKLAELDVSHGSAGNRLFYLATPPTQFQPIIECLGKHKQRSPAHDSHPWQRIILEKPFGGDLATAHSLNHVLHRHFPEEQIFRIDHFLGKETVQNLMVLRFANSIFEPIWNYKYIDHVQITVAEPIGVGSRGGYYDQAGALRDMVQNHLFQLMALMAMEPPVALDASSIRDEKLKVYKSIRPVRPDLVEQVTVRGQYGPGQVNGDKTPGYLQEQGVATGSKTETFVAVKLFIDNWRWSGTPFYLRTGKFLPAKLSEVAVRFRAAPLTLFQKQCQYPVYPNDLIIRVQPHEGIRVRLNGKVPGGSMNIKSVALDFLYRTTFQADPPDAYQRLVLDAIVGDQTLFIRGDEAEAAWTVIDPIEQQWAVSGSVPEQYPPGSWGPPRAAELIESDGRRWLDSLNAEAQPIIACSL